MKKATERTAHLYFPLMNSSCSPKALHRKTAVQIAADLQISHLSAADKLKFVSQYYLGPENIRFTKASGLRDLSEDLKEEIRSDKVPTAYSDRYEPLLKIALRRSFFGIMNRYLEESIREYSGGTVRVYGKVEAMRICLCCGYRALPGAEPGFNICLACFGQEDGFTDELHLSGPNNLTLAEARENFWKYGAVELRLVQYVVPEPERKFPRV